MEQIFSSIPAALDAFETDERIENAIVFSAWERSAGSLVAERTSAEAYDSGRLTVAVEDITWQRHLEELSPQLLAKMNSLLGSRSLRYIDFKIDAENARKNRRPVISIDEETDLTWLSPSLLKAATAIDDEALRNTFLSAAAGYLSKNGPTET